MLLEHEREYVLGMDALIYRVQSNTIVIMAWAWMLSSWSALEHDGYYGSGMDALKIVCTRTRSLLWFWHGCSQARMHSNTNRSIAWPWVLSSSSALEHERYDGLCMDALVFVCSWNTDVFYGLDMDAPNIECIRTRSIIERNRTRSLLWFGHGCSQD